METQRDVGTQDFRMEVHAHIIVGSRVISVAAGVVVVLAALAATWVAKFWGL